MGNTPPLQSEKSRYNANAIQIALIGSLGIGLLAGCRNQEIPSISTSTEATQEVILPLQQPSPFETPKPTGKFSATPTWSQDFSKSPDGPLDTKVWIHEADPAVPGYNDEKQGYTNHPQNVRIENGQLLIEAHRESYTYPNDPSGRSYDITSGRINTKNSFAFEYGKLEATMKLPEGQGTWPAFWLLSANEPNISKMNPTNKDQENDRFYLHDGELDIMEAYGHTPGIIEATAHTFKNSIEKQLAVPDAGKAFHTYGIEITPTKIIWTIDHKPYHSLNKSSENPDAWPFGNGNKFYAILNLAMGGSGGGEIDPAQSTWSMEVKSVDFYAYSRR
jgi:beta-glucanase (GH16 family)